MKLEFEHVHDLTPEEQERVKLRSAFLRFADELKGLPNFRGKVLDFLNAYYPAVTRKVPYTCIDGVGHCTYSRSISEPGTHIRIPGNPRPVFISDAILNELVRIRDFYPDGFETKEVVVDF